ncbi:hypothetical protein [Paenibacillus sp. PAMC21692]|uniref:hypothetical protein n=1 Tax=Paenibacillus sp. PAMC21692 TaxID=2762320 RepID=UPI00164CE83F|nr:hypothetical protein [Paenibacillus sp. PAMC21692]QNK57417.1 hypothetical protein H7F31_33965 [Paenibacillus sp. PAMC21692]
MDESVFDRFKYFMERETPVFRSYVMRKANGEILDIETLPPDDLQGMFIDEVITDGVIADLFDVEQKVVTRKRYKHEIKLGQTLSRKSIELIENMSKLVETRDLSDTNDLVLIPIKLIIHPADDLIFAPYRVFENDGRQYPFYDYEGLKEVDTEAFCVRISRVKREIESLLDEIIEFLWEYEWETEVYFERENDNKVCVSAILFEDEDPTAAKISLAVSLQISGLQKSGDLIFDTEYDLRTGSLSFQTEGCDFNLDVDDIEDLFLECWSIADRYVQIQNEIESELENEN